MTNQEKVRYIFDKYPETRFNRTDFFWRFLEEFHQVKFYITKDQFYGFYKEFWGVERSLRDVLKEPKYKLAPENDQKRYQLSKNFQQEYSKK